MLTIKATGRSAEQAIEDYDAAIKHAKEEGLLKELHDMRQQIRAPEVAEGEDIPDDEEAVEGEADTGEDDD